MGNGRYINGNIVLFTQFSEEKDILILINMLKFCFGLSCSINLHKKSYVIIISGQSLKLFQSIVLPYITPNMKHIIGLNTDLFFHKNTLGNNGVRSYSTVSTKNILNPYYITGFAVA
jgi:hypothetical protein